MSALQTPWEAGGEMLSEGYSATVRDCAGRLMVDHTNDKTARLIAAAPDLFTALEDFDNWFCGFNPDCQASRMEGRKVVIRARTALAKAVQA